MLLLVAAAMAQGPSPKIINGADASEGDFPATGGMLMGATLSFQGNGQDIRQFVCSCFRAEQHRHSLDPSSRSLGTGREQSEPRRLAF